MLPGTDKLVPPPKPSRKEIAEDRNNTTPSRIQETFVYDSAKGEYVRQW